MIIGITGTLAAGKGTIVEYLEKKGFVHYSVRNYLISEIEKRQMPINRDSMVFVANELRAKYGPSYIVEELYKIAKGKKQDSIIESIRAPGEIQALKDKEEFYLFSVDANQDIRYFRAIERATETDSIDFETFKQNEKREMENNDPAKQNISKCIEMSDYQFTNNGSLEELYIQIENVLEKIHNKQNNQNKNNSNLGRQDYLSWDDYFMGIALLSAQRSKDPSTQVGACIVDSEKRIVGVGYNGAPRGFEDEEFPWGREGDFLETKYAYVCHAELNAILNSTKESLKGCSIYVALFPCNECAKAIVQSGISKVFYLSDKYKDTPAHFVSEKILKSAGVELIKLNPKVDAVKLNFDRLKW